MEPGHWEPALRGRLGDFILPSKGGGLESFQAGEHRVLLGEPRPRSRRGSSVPLPPPPPRVSLTFLFLSYSL